MLVTAVVLVPVLVFLAAFGAHLHATGEGDRTVVASTLTPTASAAPSVSVDPTAVLEGQRAAKITSLLAARSRALLAGDEKAWLATVDQANPTVLARQKALFDNLRSLPLAMYRWSDDPRAPEQGYPLPAGLHPGFGNGSAYSTAVYLYYQLKGFDPGPITRVQVPFFVNRAGHWLVEGDQTRTMLPDSIVEPWDDLPVAIGQGPDVLVVLSSTDAGKMGTIVAESEQALGRARAMWPNASGHTAVLYLTGDQDALRTYAGSGTIADFAGITTAVTDPLPNSTIEGTRVLTNPLEVTPTSTGLLQLLTHEFTHVVQWNDKARGTPLWVVEGVAEYTAYRGDKYNRGIPTTLWTEAADHTLPSTLPSSAIFYKGSGEEVDTHYSYAWLAFQYISETYGESKVRLLYDQMRTVNEPTGQASRRVAEEAAFVRAMGMSEATFVQHLNVWIEHELRR